MKVTRVEREKIIFGDNEYKLYSDHEHDCCECHYLDFSVLKLEDFDGLEFDLTNDNFFERVEGYGIRLIPLQGHPVSIAGYGNNNGNYSSNLRLVLRHENNSLKSYDVSQCQSITE